MKLLLLLVLISFWYDSALALSIIQACEDEWETSSCEEVKCSGKCTHAYFIPRCQKTCGYCHSKPPKTCYDTADSSFCQEWKRRGLCFMKFRKMDQLCRKTCSMCNLQYRKCPEGWERVNDYCLKIVNKKRTFSEAYLHCYDQGGMLASIYSIFENQAILQRIRSIKSRVWFGLLDSFKENNPKFVDGTTYDGRFTYWDPKGMSNTASRDCAAFGESGDRHWRMEVCKEKLPFVCRRLPGDPCQHTCHKDAVCRPYRKYDSELGAFRCVCKPGFLGNGIDCQKPCLCVASGDPHYRTSDGVWIHFMGRCKYTMAKSTDAPKGCDFEVRVKNHDILADIRSEWRSLEVSWTRYVELHLGGEVVKLGQKKVVHVNGEKQLIPFKNAGENKRFSVIFDGDYVVAYSKVCGIAVGFDGFSAAFVKAKRQLYGGKMTGICGNCNGDRMDDLTTKEGLDVVERSNKYALIGNSYRVSDPEDAKMKKKCEDGNDHWPSCDDALIHRIKSKAYCGKFTDMNSPFGTCMHAKEVDYEGYFDACVFDVCAYFKKKADPTKAVCAGLATMAEECAENRYRVDWRKRLGCEMKCGKNMVYRFTTPVEEKDCYNYKKIIPDEEQPKEGCVCIEGFVRSGDSCIRPEHCGCQDELGYYHNIGGSWVNKRCSARLTCEDTGKTKSESMKCVENANCRIEKDVRGCFCDSGFTGTGTKSCQDIDECQKKPCHENAICSNTPGSYTCKCKPGFSRDGETCKDVDECKEDKNICRDVNAACRNTFGSYKCDCNDGFTRKSPGMKCEDLKECSLGNFKCTPNSHCVNTVGSYRCACNKGYEKDGSRCVDIDECSRDLHDCDKVNGNCMNKPGTFECSCKKGYELMDNNKCKDIDECIELSPTLPDSETCKNTPGSYELVCEEGYRKNKGAKPTDGCHDIDECKEDSAKCHQHAVCRNTRGGYGCTCKQHYEGNGFSTCVPKKFCGTSEANCDPNARCTDHIGSYTCKCKEGYTGTGKHCEDENECRVGGGHNCDKNANCHNIVGSFKCGCKNGYEGSGVRGDCKDINECESDGDNACHKKAMCENTVGSYRCKCDAGFQGDGMACTNINECREEKHDCSDHADCQDTPGSWRCTCRPGYTGDGKTCKNIDECTERKDTCDVRVRADCTDTMGSFTCKCKTGYKGDGHQCRSPIAECKKNSEGVLVCRCPSGYWGNGTECRDINECVVPPNVRAPCHEEAVCTNTKGGFKCACNDGFEGSGYECRDIDECAKPDACMENAECENQRGGYKCVCKEGFVMKGALCVDMDECDLNKHDCDNNAHCTNTIGSYTCKCKEGYSGIGKLHTCDNVNECESGQHNCHDNATCIDKMGTFECHCKTPHYTGNGFNCEDVDECVDKTAQCSPRATCENLDGGYKCTCKSGFEGNGKTCRDVHECSDGIHKCDPNAKCINEIGSYSCSCNNGYTGDGKSCQDIDECKGKHECHKNAICTNIDGSYTCKCKPNYRGDGRKFCDWILVNECKLGTDRCHDNALCIDETRGYSCKCKSGYVGDGYNCANEDECKRDDSPCHRDAQCTDMNPGYKCKCKPGFRGDGKTCTDIDECRENKAKCHSNAMCINRVGSYQCKCKRGYSGSGLCCKDVNECVTKQHDCEQGSVCINEIGSYRCECIPGYYKSGNKCVKGDCTFTKKYGGDLSMSLINGVDEISEEGEDFSILNI